VRGHGLEVAVANSGVGTQRSPSSPAAPAPENIESETALENPIGEHLETERRGKDQCDPDDENGESNHEHFPIEGERCTHKRKEAAQGISPKATLARRVPQRWCQTSIRIDETDLLDRCDVPKEPRAIRSTQLRTTH